MSVSVTCMILSVLLAFLLPLLWKVFSALRYHLPVPKLEDGWWVTNPRPDYEEIAVRSFTIHVPDEVLADLRVRLEQATRLSRPLVNTNFTYGFNTDSLRSILQYWMNQYHWREQEKLVNQYPHFKTQIEGLYIHFIHVKPKASSTKVLPLLMLHGWPGSVVEFFKVIPLLTQPQEQYSFVFELVIPSLPGYGFSQAAQIPGLSPVEMAQIFDKLMKRLKFDQYYVQGGDWGSVIGNRIATLFPHSYVVADLFRGVKGLHLNFATIPKVSAYLKIMLGSFWPSLLAPEQHQGLFYPVLDKLAFLLRESGYYHLQATKPDTLGVALSDSPAGLAAYLLEKFSTATNRYYVNEPDGGLTKKFTLDELLTNVMIYWVTNSITSSIRLYAEASSKRNRAYQMDEIPCVVPTGVAAFPEEILIHPAIVLSSKFVNLVSYNYMPRGGHFAAFEEPALFAEDVCRVINHIETIS